jgi:hypothetical protein
MRKARRVQSLQKLLALCDDLQQLRSRIRDPELASQARSRLRSQSKRKGDELAKNLSSYRFRGPLGEVLRQYRFRSEHFLVLAFLLHRHLRSETPATPGRIILASVYETSFEVLTGLELLHESSPLRQSALVVLEDDDEPVDDVLEARFRLAEDALVAFRDEISGLVPEDLRRSAATAYHSNRQFLIDLRILHNLYKERSERVFNPERWDRLHAEATAPGRGLTRRIEAFWQRVRIRLAATDNGVLFPAVRFMSEHLLSEAEMMIVIHLLFKELYQGNAYADAAELLRLVSASEDDLIANRRLVMTSSTLRKSEVINVEPMIEGRDLTSEIHLADWVVNALFGAPVPDRGIRPDDKLDWHLYLRNLPDTGRFFRDLDAN